MAEEEEEGIEENIKKIEELETNAILEDDPSVSIFDKDMPLQFWKDK